VHRDAARRRRPAASARPRRSSRPRPPLGAGPAAAPSTPASTP
jgi:hypothetical protein